MATEVSAGAAGGEGRTEHAAGLPARILDVAIRLFAEHGWTGTSVRAVAEQAGCTTPALYYHFASKEALWVSAVEGCYLRLIELQVANLAAADTVRERLERSMQAVIDIANTEPHRLWLLYRSGRHPEEGQPEHPYAAARARTREQTVAMVRGGVDSGELRADVDPDVVVSLVYGAMDHRLGELFYQGRPFEERWAERTVEHLFRGLEP